jgi:hypothetical protein
VNIERVRFWVVAEAHPGILASAVWPGTSPSHAPIARAGLLDKLGGSGSPGRMSSAATAVQLYDQGDSGEEMHPELLAGPDPATGAGKSVRLSRKGVPRRA